MIISDNLYIYQHLNYIRCQTEPEFQASGLFAAAGFLQAKCMVILAAWAARNHLQAALAGEEAVITFQGLSSFSGEFLLFSI